MDVKTQRWGLAVLGVALLGTLLAVELRELDERRRALGLAPEEAIVPKGSASCVECHQTEGLGVVEPWRQSVHGRVGVGCLDCHAATREQADGYDHYGERLVTVVTPIACGSCHPVEAEQFGRSAHARAAERLETPAGVAVASRAASGDSRPCESCHGSTLRLVGTGGERIEASHLQPDEQGRPRSVDVARRVARDADGLPSFDRSSWPNAGVGRRNLDGSVGSCVPCHGRHGMSARRARRPESCAPCHAGREQPESEIFTASRHGALWQQWAGGERIDQSRWELGRDHAVAPSCATCHMSGHSRSGGAATHDPGVRLGWQHSAEGSRRTNTDAAGRLVARHAPDQPPERAADSWQDKRERMRQICRQCHAATVVEATFDRLDSFVQSVDETFVEPSAQLQQQLLANGFRSVRELDEPIEWQAYELTQVATMTAKLGVAMGSPDHAGAQGTVAAARLVCGPIVGDVQRMVEQAHADAASPRATDDVVRALTAAARFAGCSLRRETKEKEGR